MSDIACPVCGYDPDNKAWATDDKLLKKRQMENYIRVHSQQAWWFSQPQLVCRWVKNHGIEPESILDAGCGDARWLPGIIDTWPGAEYLGIDQLDDHIRNNQEAFPEHHFVSGRLQKMKLEKCYAMVLIGGTFNPGMEQAEQTAFIKGVKAVKPNNILVLFDFNSKGTRPDGEFLPEYSLENWFDIPKDQQSPFQDIRAFLYQRHKENENKT